MMPEMKTDFLRSDDYGADDLNRVGSAVQHLTGVLQSYGYAISTIPKTDWTDGDEPNHSEMELYLNNVKAIKSTFYGQNPLPESVRFLDAEGANNIEKLLLEVDGLIQNMISRFYYSGELYSGE